MFKELVSDYLALPHVQFFLNYWHIQLLALLLVSSGLYFKFRYDESRR